MEKKNCPYCGEEILDTAKKCKHCGEWLEVKEKEKELIPCPCCGEEIEAGTENCIHCNEQLPDNKIYDIKSKMSINNAIVVSILASLPMVLCFILFFVGDFELIGSDTELEIRHASTLFHNVFPFIFMSSLLIAPFQVWLWIYFRKYISFYDNQNNVLINWIIFFNVLGVSNYIIVAMIAGAVPYLILLAILPATLMILLARRLMTVTNGHQVHLLRHLSKSIFITQPAAYLLAFVAGLWSPILVLPAMIIGLYPNIVLLFLFLNIKKEIKANE